MKTFKVIENWEVLKEYASEKLKEYDKNAVCIMHSAEESYIRATDVRILKALSEKYHLEESEPPDIFFEPLNKWSFWGNLYLFEESDIDNTLRFV